MKQRLFIMGLIMTMLLSGCSYSVLPEEKTSDIQNSKNPFEDVTGSNLIGDISHGPLDISRSEKGDILPYEYDGGEFSLKYHFSATGKAESIGFLLFLNGEPQPYKVDNTEELSYCHSFPMKDSTEQDITFIFTPVAGYKDDTLNLTILSLYYPTFQPDMETTSSYGFYHGILQYQVPIEFHVDAPVDSLPEHLIADVVTELDVRVEKFTKDFIETELPANGVTDVTAIETNAYYTIAYDEKLKFDNLNLTGKDTVTIRYMLCGPQGAKFNTIFYLNHQPISYNHVTSYKTRLTKGGVWVAEITIDMSKLDDFSTFYVISVPADGNRDSMTIKTNSILFYKEK